MLRKLAIAAALAWGSAAFAAPNLLYTSCHAASSGAISGILGGGVVDVSVFVDMTSACPDQSFVNVVPLMTNGSAPFFSLATNLSDNHANYAVGNTSFSGWDETNDDLNNYAAYVAGAMTQSKAYAPNGGGVSVIKGTPPPVAAVNVSPSESGWGIEFGYPASPPTGCISSPSPSDATACLSQVLVVLKAQHPTWNFFDIKGALRQTASNWPTWSPGNGVGNPYGYGLFNYASAAAVANTSTIYLQPPVMTLAVADARLTIAIYPSRTARRDHEEVYMFAHNQSFPTKNEYVTADITTAHGTLVYTSNGTDVIPQATINAPSWAGGRDYVAFTTDGSGNYSAVQTWAVLTPAACLF